MKNFYYLLIESPPLRNLCVCCFFLKEYYVDSGDPIVLAGEITPYPSKLILIDDNMLHKN